MTIEPSAVPALPAKRHQQLPDEVASYVRELIISGAVPPGEFLRLEPIAEAIGVSVTPVREGLRSLQSEGFVRLVPRRGFVVEGFSPQDVRDLFWAQAQLAGELASRAAERITTQQVARLESVVEAYDEAVARRDADRMAELGHQFHSIVNIAAESPRLAQLLATVVNQLPNRFYASIEGQAADTQEQHPRLIEALRRRATKRARLIMEQHILEGADHLIDLLQKRGLWDKRAAEVEVTHLEGSA